MRLQVRRAQDLVEGEIVYEGELFYNDQTNRFGIYLITDGGRIHWFPEVDDNLFLIGADENITGRDLSGNVNNLMLDWSVPDILQIKNRNTGGIVASFGSDGTILNILNPEITALANSRNLAINGSLAIKRNVGFLTTFQTNPGTSNIHMFAPNWLVWCTDSSDGTLTVQYDEIDVVTSTTTHDRVLSVTSSDYVSDSGVRVFFYDYAGVAGTVITVSFDFFAPEDEVSKVRVLSAINSEILESEITGTGAWSRAEIQVSMPAGAPTWWAVDVLYEPSASSEDAITWKVGGLQVNPGATSRGYERRQKSVEKSLVDTIYQEGRVFIADDAQVVSVSLNSPVIVPNIVEMVNPTDGTQQYTDLDITGFELSIPDLVDANGSILKYAAFAAYPSS